MSALDIIREKKRIHGWGKLTALQMVIWEAYYKGKENDNAEQIQIAETAAEDLAAKDNALETIEERCDEELGEWSSVEYAHLPVSMSVFWFIRESARRSA